PAQQRPQVRHPFVGKLSLHDRRPVLEYRHRSKFVNSEAFAVETAAFLPEQDGSLRVKFDGNCHKREQRQEGRQGCPGKQDVHASLCSLLKRSQWAALQLDTNGITKLTIRSPKYL